MAVNREKRYVSDNAQLMAEWDWEKNTEFGFEPNKITCGSDKKIWWKCNRGHEWRATIGSRNSGCGCPYCAGIYAIKGETDLQTVNPALAKEWDYEKNYGLRPEDVTSHSHKRVWWKCQNGHSWQTAVSKRTSGQNCPFCSGKKAWKGYNDISITNPELISEWDFEKNDIPPYAYRPMSNKKVWWICDKGHSWSAAIAKRVSGEKCPVCQGKKILIGYNDLATTHPFLALEWDSNKNNHTMPCEVSKGSSKKVWWICKRGHSWKAAISSRADGVGCPLCAKELQTSYPEKILYYYIKKLFPDTISNYKNKALYPFELDVYIPTLRIGIEYDGERWHQNMENDLKKNQKCATLSIKLIRVREPGCPILYDNLSKNIVLEDKKTGICKAVEKVFDVISHVTQEKYVVDIDLARDNAEILTLLDFSEKDNSLCLLYPNLALEWDYEKNGTLLPKDFSVGSKKRVWWICNFGHSYFSSIVSRTKGRGCPVCSGKKIQKGYNDFESHYPELAKDWDYSKNEITPDMISYGSDKKFWWKCEKGHSYECSINNRRNGQSCYYCSGKRVLAGFNDISTTHPDIAKQWCFELNDLNPTEVNAGSHKRVWWQCNICGHRWISFVYNRCLQKSGCPKCSGRVE